MNTAKFFLDNITTIIDTFDSHDAGIQDDGRYRCHCGWLGSEAVWREHLADAMADAIDEQVVHLPELDFTAEAS